MRQWENDESRRTVRKSQRVEEEARIFEHCVSSEEVADRISGSEKIDGEG